MREGPAARIGRRFKDLLQYEHWNIGILRRPIQSLLDRPNVSDARWLIPQPTGSYVADPFGYSRDGKDVLICEAYDYRTKRGTIVAGDFDPASTQIDFSTVLEKDHHLSYPYIVDGITPLTMVPEAAQSNAVKAYSVGDHGACETEGRILLRDVAAVDSSIVHHDGRWWLFCTTADAPLLKLSIFYAMQFEGPWQAHARNPVKTDIRSARPGGTPFIASGSLFRPAQDCSSSYGARVSLNRISLLTPDDFAEETVAVIEPDARSPFRDGLHTVSAFGECTLIDGKYHRFLFPEFAAKLSRFVTGRSGR